MTARDVIATALSNLDDACGDWSPNAMENAVAALEALGAAGYRVVRQEVVPHIKIAGDDRPLWWDIVDAPGEPA